MERIFAGVIIGLISLLAWPNVPSPWIGWCLMLIVLTIVRKAPLLGGCLLGTSLCILLINHQFNDLPNLFTPNSSIKGTITSLPKQGKFGTRFIFKIGHIATQLKIDRATGKISVYWPGHHQLKMGQQLLITGRARPLHGLVNQGGFNYQRWLVASGVSAQFTVTTGQLVSSAPSYRQLLIEQMASQFSGLSQRQFLTALSVGDKSGFSDNDWQVLKRTGTGHLFAISGLHLSLLTIITFSVAHFVSNKVYRGCHPQRVKLACIVTSLIVAAGYAYLSGFNLPVQRAFSMLLILFVFTLLGQQLHSHTKLLFCLLIIILLSPTAILGASFWLSFGAISIIYLLISSQSPALLVSDDASWFEKAKLRLRGWFAQLIKLQVSLFVGLLIINCIFFGGVSVIAPLANMIAVPIVSIVILPLVFIATFALILFGENIISRMGWLLSNSILDWLIGILDFISQWEGGWLGLEQSHYGWILGLVSVVSLLLLYYQRQAMLGVSVRRFAASVHYFLWISLLLVSIIINKDKELTDQQWQVTFLDVGQGNASIVIRNGRAIIIDSGDIYRSGASVATRIIKPFLDFHGIDIVDYIIVTHDDNDHSGGLTALSSYYNNASLIGNQHTIGDVTLDVCDTLEPILWQHLTLRFAKVPDDIVKSDNDRSCLIQITGQHHSVLFTGDIQKKAERYFAKNLNHSWQSTVLQVPHHGSKTSSSEEFLRLISPKLAVISSSRFNQWRFPNHQVLTRLSKLSINYYNTGSAGQVTVTFSNNGLKVRRYRENIAPFWYNRDLSFGHYRR